MKCVPHSKTLPVPHLPTNLVVVDESEWEVPIEVENEEQNNPTFETNIFSANPRLLMQSNLNDLVLDLHSSKLKSCTFGFYAEKMESPSKRY